MNKLIKLQEIADYLAELAATEDLSGYCPDISLMDAVQGIEEYVRFERDRHFSSLVKASELSQCKPKLIAAPRYPGCINIG